MLLSDSCAEEVGLVSLWRIAGFFPEDSCKVALGAESQKGGNLRIRIFRIEKHIFRCFNALLADIFRQGHSHFAVKKSGKVAWMEPCFLSKLLQGDCFIQMVVDVVNALHDRSGINGLFFDFASWVIKTLTISSSSVLTVSVL